MQNQSTQEKFLNTKYRLITKLNERGNPQHLTDIFKMSDVYWLPSVRELLGHINSYQENKNRTLLGDYLAGFIGNLLLDAFKESTSAEELEKSEVSNLILRRIECSFGDLN